MATKIFLIRHASPDHNRKDLPYDILPGPPLSPKGEKEAMQLADFLNTHQIVRLYHSPFDRTAKTAQIVSAQNDIPCEEDARLAEWRGQVEPESSVRERMRAVFAFAAAEAPNSGPIGLVSHGGPLDLLLRELGMDLSELATYKTRFDTTNPLPPAGVWVVEQNPNASTWKFHLAFIPTVNEGQRPIA